MRPGRPADTIGRRATTPVVWSLCLSMALAACVSKPRYRTSPAPERRSGNGAPPAASGGDGDRPAPRVDRSGAFQVGKASYYGHKFHGRPTASGVIFDMNGFSAAHRELPLGTIIKVTHLGNGRSIQLEVNDRGPFVDDRILDLSLGAAKRLDMIEEGVAEVKIELVKEVD